QNGEKTELARIVIECNGFEDRANGLGYYAQDSSELYEYLGQYDRDLKIPEQKKFPVDLEETEKIVLRAEDTDKSITITDAEEMKAIRDELESNTYTEQADIPDGKKYRLTFQDDEGDTLAEISVNTKGFVYKGTMYNSTEGYHDGSTGSSFMLYDHLGKYDKQLGLE
ncbi:MAG: hypothetical protein Q4D42_01460, partial [Eubacteriales bacterium]|nr:hypothetical protein [Eubacteriales bacterium]